jgi:hemoglobin/transferrin/lactoferrin receptor protein
VQRGGVSTFLNLNDPAHLDGFEIVRGPSSAQYNSDSLGGTVHLLSRSAAFAPEGRTVRGEMSGSLMSAARAASTSALVSYATRRFAALSSITLRDNNDVRTGGGIDSRAAVTRFLGLRSDILGTRLQGTGYAQYGGVARFQYAPTALTQVTVHYERNQQDGARRHDQLLGGDGNLIADVRNLALDFGYVRFSAFRAGPFDHVSATTSYNTQREERVNQGGNGNPRGAISHQYERVKSNGANVFASRQAGRNEFLMGADVYRETVVAPAYTFDPVSGTVVAARPRVPDGSRYLLYGGYVQNALQVLANRLRVSGSLRYGGASYVSLAANSPLVGGKPLFPDDRFHANNLSGRIGAVLTIIPTLGLYGNYSRGFRAPNITDLGTLGLQGNGMFEAAVADLAGRNATVGHRADDLAESTGRPVAGLRPEISDNYELGARFRTDRLSASLTGFVMDVRNSIVSQTLILPPGAAGTALGDQTIIRQLPTGAVVVPLSSNPVQVRTNMGGMRTFGLEHTFDVRIRRTLFWRSNVTWLYARDLATGLPPDMEGGTPPLLAHGALRYMPTSRPWWVEVYGTVAGRQNRLSSLALSDRRIGAGRSRSNIASFFNNGARARGLVSAGPDGRAQTPDDVLLATGETLDQVQNRVLGDARSAPMFSYLPGYAFAGIRGGFRAGEKTDAFFDFSNILDRNYRAMGGGIDAPGRHITVTVRRRF